MEISYNDSHQQSAGLFELLQGVCYSPCTRLSFTLHHKDELCISFAQHITNGCSFGVVVQLSQSLMFNANSAIFQLYHDENKLIFNLMMMKSALYYTNTLCWIFIVLAICRLTRTHYPASEPTSLCSFSMLCA